MGLASHLDSVLRFAAHDAAVQHKNEPSEGLRSGRRGWGKVIEPEMGPYLEMAALWWAVLREEDSPRHRALFAEWLAASPKHVEAMLLFWAAIYPA